MSLQRLVKFAIFAALLGLKGMDGQIAIYVISGSNLPANCSVLLGQVFFKTTGGAGVKGLYQCGLTDNTWTYVGSSASSSVTSWNGRTGAVLPANGDYSISQVTNGLSNVLTSANFFVGNGSNIATGVTMSGDATLANTGAITLATVNSGPGLCADSIHVCQITTNGKGLTTLQAAVSINFPVSSVFGRAGAVVANSGDYTVSQITGAAPLASPTFTGVPAAPTPATGDNSTTLATTAFVKNQGYITSNAVTSVFSRTGAVVATSGDYTISQITNGLSNVLTSAHLFVGNGSNVATDVAASGDLTLANTGAFTFNTVNSVSGTCGDATDVCQVTTNTKGLVTNQTAVPISFPAGSNFNGFGMWQLTIPSNSTFSWANQGSAQVLTGTNFIAIESPPSNTYSLHIRHLACPSNFLDGTHDLFALIVTSCAVSNSTCLGGVEIDDGTKAYVAEYAFNGGSSALQDATYTAFSGGTGTGGNQDVGSAPVPIWWHIHMLSSTTFRVHYSFDGAGTPGNPGTGGWRELNPSTGGSLSAVTNCGFFSNSQNTNTGASTTLLSWAFVTALTAQ